MPDSALTGPRLMEKMVDEYIGLYSTPDNSFPAYKGWVPSNDGLTLMHESYFDLSGYTNDHLTTFPVNAGLQDPGYYTVAAAGIDGSTRLIVLDIMSQERLDIEAVDTDWRGSKNVPGMPTSTEDFEQIILGRLRMMAPQTDFRYVSALSPIAGGEFGSASPTTVAKLWCYRFLIYSSETYVGAGLEVNATRFVLSATIIEEEDLPFIMRQKRSFELSTQG